MANHILKSVTMLLSIISNVMVVISTMTETTVAITTQRQTHQDALTGTGCHKAKFIRDTKLITCA